MKPINVTDATFKSEVFENKIIVLADFWAPWCGPCKALTPLLEEIAASWSGHLKVVKINVDENRQRASELGITSIPALIFFKDGQIVDRLTGWILASQLSLRIERLISKTAEVPLTSVEENGTQ